MKARVCYGCKQPRGVFAIDGGYWHPKCFRAASPEARVQAREAAYSRGTP